MVNKTCLQIVYTVGSETHVSFARHKALLIEITSALALVDPAARLQSATCVVVDRQYYRANKLSTKQIKPKSIGFKSN